MAFVTINILLAVLWVVTPCGDVVGGPCCLFVHGGS